MFDYTVFDYLLDSVFVIDADGKVVYCNEMAANLLQTSARRVIGKAFLSNHIKFAEPGLLPFTQYSILARDGYLPSGGIFPPCIRLFCWLLLSAAAREKHKSSR